jgi:hypothetical protein
MLYMHVDKATASAKDKGILFQSITKSGFKKEV